MHQKAKFQFHGENRPAEGEMGMDAFGGLKTGPNSGGRCSEAHSVKSGWKTTHTLKHMLNLRKFPIDWV